LLNSQIAQAAPKKVEHSPFLAPHRRLPRLLAFLTHPPRAQASRRPWAGSATKNKMCLIRQPDHRHFARKAAGNGRHSCPFFLNPLHFAGAATIKNRAVVREDPEPSVID
jgi:hypothetical protein